MNSENGSEFDFNEDDGHLSSLLENQTRPQFSKDQNADPVTEKGIENRLEFELSKIEEEDAISTNNQITKSMGEQVSASTYFSCLFSYLAVIAIMAISIDDLTFIFGFIAGVSETFLNFIFPACFAYLAAIKTGHKLSLFNKVTIFMFGGIGVAFFFVANYFNVLKMCRGESPSH